MNEPDLTADEIREITAESYADPLYFCKFFLSHLFPKRVPWVHRGILAILSGKVDWLEKYGEVDLIIENFTWVDKAERVYKIFYRDEVGKLRMQLGKYTEIMMPRGSSKTTLVVAMILYKVVFEENSFGVYVSNAAPHAKMQINNVKRELEDNRRLLKVFGNLKPNLRDSEKWSEELFECINGCAFAARGSGGQIRGLNHRGQRPKLIIVDDVEDKESVSTELQRNKTRSWFYSDLIPALPEMDDSSTIIGLGTMLHREDLLNTLTSDPEWNVVKFGIYDKAGDPIWPEFMDRAKDERRKASFAAAGQLHVYYMEFHNKASSPDINPFKPDWFIYEPPPKDADGVEKLIQHAIYIDPAISPKRTADKTAIVVAGMAANGVIYVRACVAQRGMSEQDKIDTYFRLAQKYHCRQHGVESIAYQSALAHSIREQMFRKKHYFEIVDIPHKGRKTSRILAIIQPRLSSGHLKFERRFPDLEIELVDFRSDTDDQPDDCADALAACIVLLDPYAAMAAPDDEEGKGLEADEYEPLAKVFADENGDGDWRSA